MNGRGVIFVAKLSAVSALLLTSCIGGGDKGIATTVTDSGYTRALQSQFNAAWEQPASVAAPSGKISVPVEVEIDRDGRVAAFRIAQPSGIREVDNSIRAIGKRIRQVDPPPVTADAKRLKLRINFDLDVRR
jgi:TonB family protein